MIVIKQVVNNWSRKSNAMLNSFIIFSSFVSMKTFPFLWVPSWTKQLIDIFCFWSWFRCYFHFGFLIENKKGTKNPKMDKWRVTCLRTVVITQPALNLDYDLSHLSSWWTFKTVLLVFCLDSMHPRDVSRNCLKLICQRSLCGIFIAIYRSWNGFFNGKMICLMTLFAERNKWRFENKNDRMNIV